MNNFYLKDSEKIMHELNTSEKGLSSEEAERRLDEYGKNTIEKKSRRNILYKLLEQFKSILIIILVIAAAVSFLIAYYTNSSLELISGFVILIVVFINVFLGFMQEYRAEKAMEALQKYITPKALVRRDNEIKEIPSSDVVPGDYLILQRGRRIPADARIAKQKNLAVDESTLTGESTPSIKTSKNIEGIKQVTERNNMVFSGTVITHGSGEAVVVSTGKKTEIGLISESLIKIPEQKTPMQEKIENFGKRLSIVALLLAIGIFILELYVGVPLIETFFIAVSLAVSAVPEGLPTVVTLTLALGMQAMARKNALVRKMSAVETLGMTTIICTDKTGTLTKNEMTVQKIFTDNKFIKVTGTGYQPNGDFFIDDKKIKPLENIGLNLLLKNSVLCNNTEIKNPESIIGDPTEAAILVMAEKAGINPRELKNKYEFLNEISFSSERKMMSVVYSENSKNILYSKGAPEVILEKSEYILENGRKKKLTRNRIQEINQASEKMAKQGLRILAFAYKPVSSKRFSEENLIFIGIVGMEDPPREEVAEAIKASFDAGIKPIMITGDNKNTAIAIANKIKLMRVGDEILTGNDLEQMSQKELENRVDKVSVYARVSPEHKVRILDALKSKNQIVAMTGDGVNDAPALKNSHVGIAMGIKGTDVAKEASDIILQDDNYSTIVKAIGMGRNIYDNIKKFITFLLSANVGEMIIISAAAFMKMPLPLIPLHILWDNIVTDSTPALVLAFEPAEENVMKREPRNPEQGLLHNSWTFLLIAGIIGAIATLAVFSHGLNFGVDKARTMAFTTIVIFQLFFIFNCRSEEKSIFKNNPFTNPKLVLAVLFSIGMQALVIYTPFLQMIFRTVALNFQDWTIILLAASTAFFIIPSWFNEKNLKRRLHKIRNFYSEQG